MTSLFEERLLFSNTLKIDKNSHHTLNVIENRQWTVNKHEMSSERKNKRYKINHHQYTNYVCEAILHAGVKDEGDTLPFPVCSYIPVVRNLSVSAEC